MRIAAFLLSILALQGCATKSLEIDRLNANLKGDKLVGFEYVGDRKYSPISCDKPDLQTLLMDWSNTLRPAPIASWPDAGVYFKLAFENGNEFNLGVFEGNSQSDYSVLYLADGIKSTGGIYTGDPLVPLNSLCNYAAKKASHGQARTRLKNQPE